MKNLKLITILKTFSKDEMRRFGKFIKSPYFNGERDFKPLYSVLKKLHPQFPEKKMDEIKLFHKLYPDKTFDEKKSLPAIRVLFSQLTSLARKFIVYERFEQGKDDYSYRENEVQSLRERNLLKLALHVHIINSQALDAGEKNSDYYYRRTEINELLTELHSFHDKSRDHFRHSGNNLLFIVAYLFNKLAYHLNTAAIDRINRNMTIKGLDLARSLVMSFEPELFEKECDNDGFETKNMTLYNYYLIKSRFETGSSESLMKAMDYYYLLFPKVSRDIQFRYQVRLHNLLMARLSIDKIYAIKLNELYDFAWSRGIINSIEDGFLDPRGFLNALKIKSYLLKSSELRKFIVTFIEKVSPEYREDFRNLSMAHLCFKEKHFGKCLEYLSKKDEFDQDGRAVKYRLIICCLFEEGMYEEAIYAVESFEQYIKRQENEIGPSSKKYMDFVKAFKFILKLASGSNLPAEANFAKLIETDKHTIFGDWLIEKNRKLLKHKTATN